MDNTYAFYVIQGLYVDCQIWGLQNQGYTIGMLHKSKFFRRKFSNQLLRKGLQFVKQTLHTFLAHQSLAC